MPEPLVIAPQSGYQQSMLSTPADIAIGGGAAGAGKTWALLAEPVRHKDVSQFGAVFFRRESPQLTAKGSIWDQSERFYPLLGAVPTRLHWEFPSGMNVHFSHMADKNDHLSWLGAEIPLIGFDQLETFLEHQFWYMLSRSRSLCGVTPYIRGTCNPVPDDDPVGGWLNKLIAWWVDKDTGYAIPERSGVLRWMARLADVLHWGDSREELIARFPEVPLADLQPKSVTFIPGSLDENKILMSLDPSYRANLLAQDPVTRERLLKGNWKIKATAGKVFNRTWFKTILNDIPGAVVFWIRYWDKAGTEEDGAYSAGVLIGIYPNKQVVIADVVRGRWSAGGREAVILQTTRSDQKRFGDRYAVWVEAEPGSGGKESAENTVLNLSGHVVRTEHPTGTKLARAGPLSAASEAGNVHLVNFMRDKDSNMEALLNELQNFDGVRGYMDQVDAASGAYNKLQRGMATGELEIISPGGGLPQGDPNDSVYAEELARARAAYGKPEETVQ